MDTPFSGRHLPGGVVQHIDRRFLPEGDVWWVSATHASASDASGYGLSPDKPFATIAYANSVAGAGDTIFVCPAHTEIIGKTGAAAITFSAARLRIIGLGGRTTRPYLLIDGFADTYIHVTGADFVLENLTIKAGHADIAKAIYVAADGCEIRGCRFVENVTAENFLICVLTAGANTADLLVIEECEAIQPDAANTHFLSCPSAQDSIIVRHNILQGDWGTAALGAAGTLTNPVIYDNYIENASTATTVAQDLTALFDPFFS